MSNYTITTDFGAKDSLPSSNSAKVVRGSEFTTEFTNIQTAIATKADTAGDTFTGVVNFSADVAVNTNTLFVDVSEAKVGIGNTSPAEKLDVSSAGTTRIQVKNTNLTSSGLYIAEDATGAQINELGAYPIRFNTSGTERMRITSSGNVGIGATSPTALLHLESASAPTLKIDDSDSTLALELSQDGADGSMLLKSAGTLSIGVTNNSASDTVSFQTQSTERMRIDSSGNVGIGTDSPDRIVHAEGTPTVFGDSRSVLQLADDTAMAAGVGGGLILTGKALTGQANANTVFGAIQAQKENGTSGNTDSYMTFCTRQNGNNPAERMRIDSSGNLLVATTTNPVSSSSVEGLYYEADNYFAVAAAGVTSYFNRQGDDGSITEFRKDGTPVGSIGTAGGDLFIGTGSNSLRFLDTSNSIIPTDGDGIVNDAAIDLGYSSSRFKDLHLSGVGYFGTSVGIGTTSPATKLHIENGASANNIIQVYGGTSLYAGIGVDGNGAIFTAGSSGSLNAPMIFRTASNGTEAERMRLSQSGNVLVGKTAVEMAAVGVEVKPAGEVRITSDDVFGLQLNRKTGDGEIINLRKDGASVGSIGVSGSRPYLSNGVNDGIKIADDYVAPCNQTGADKDASLDLGSSSVRFKDIYRSGSTYSTSDRNKKQDIRDLTDAEARVATVAKGSLKAFRYIDSVEAEGDEANIHFGIIAQDLKAAFEAEGLNANDYQVFKTSTYTDDDGVEQTTYSVCYENLLAFIIAAI